MVLIKSDDDDNVGVADSIMVLMMMVTIQFSSVDLLSFHRHCSSEDALRYSSPVRFRQPSLLVINIFIKVVIGKDTTYSNRRTR